MLQFLSLPALLALCALVAPLAVHLLSRKPGNIVKVGSLKFLEASESRQLRSLKLTDLPLLLVRLALITVLALLLAKPFWQSLNTPTEGKAHGWVLIAPEFKTELHDISFDQMLDSLVAAGDELHFLAPDFAAVQTASGKIVTQEAPACPNYWSLLRELDQKLPNNLPLWIFAPDRLSFFRGVRPTLQRPVHWFAIPEPRENRWIQQVRVLKNDSVSIAVGFSDSRQTKFTHGDLYFPNQKTAISQSGLPALEINPSSKSLYFLEKDIYASDDFFSLPDAVDSETVMIWHDDTRAEDARYIRLALETVIEFGRLPIIVKSQGSTAKNEMPQDVAWGFWLTEQPLPQVLLQQMAQGLCLISDASSQEYENVASFIAVKTPQAEHVVNLSRRVLVPSRGMTLWTDGFGGCILEAERYDKGWHYRFHSRFHPTWNELVLSAALPEWLNDLLGQSAKISRRSDQRRISAGQSRPQIKLAATFPTTRMTNLHLQFSIFAVILFLTERWLAAKKKHS